MINALPWAKTMEVLLVGIAWAVPGQDQCHAHAQLYSLVGLVAGKNVVIEAALGK